MRSDGHPPVQLGESGAVGLAVEPRVRRVCALGVAGRADDEWSPTTVVEVRSLEISRPDQAGGAAQAQDRHDDRTVPRPRLLST